MSLVVKLKIRRHAGGPLLRTFGIKSSGGGIGRKRKMIPFCTKSICEPRALDLQITCVQGRGGGGPFGETTTLTRVQPENLGKRKKGNTLSC